MTKDFSSVVKYYQHALLSYSHFRCT